MPSEAPVLSITLLGGVEIAIDDAPRPIGGRSPRRLVGVLALERGRIVQHDRLVDVLWTGVEPPPSAHRTIQSLVSRLRRTIGTERIEHVHGGYRLALEPDDRIDVDTFDELLASARFVGDPATRIDLLERALAMWRGRPFGELADEPSFVSAASRLEEQRATALEDRAAALIDAGDHTIAVAELEELLGSRPLRERPWKLAMVANYLSGRPAEAVRVLGRYRSLLANEAGLEPSAAVSELELRILRNEDVSELGAGPRARARGYALDSLIGAGPAAHVHRATRTDSGSEVALKIIRPEALRNAAAVRRFDAEIRLWGQIEHPNIVVLHDRWRGADEAGLVMRLMSGGSLLDRLAAERPWDVDATLALVDQLAAGLSEVHRIGLVHGAVHGNNVLFDEAGSAHLGDIGTTALAGPGAARSVAGDVRAVGRLAASLLTGTDLARHDDVVAIARRRRPDLPPAFLECLACDEAIDGVDPWAERLRSAAPGLHRSVRRARNPFKGLRAFREVDAPDFHGRDRMTAETLDHLHRSAFVTIVGPSGSGKSSLVRAGVIPALQAASASDDPTAPAWVEVVVTPGDRPWLELEAGLARACPEPPSDLRRLLLSGRDGLLRAALRVCPAGEDVRLLLVIDQFEELWTHVDDVEERAGVLDALVAATTARRSPVTVVATLRADFVGRALEHAGLAERLREGTVLLPPLSPEELERAVRGPLQARGVDVEPALLTRLVGDVSRAPGSLPFLQFVLRHLFTSRSGDLRLEAYESTGGLVGALVQRADQLWDSLDDGDRAAFRRLCRRLVAPGEDRADTRRRADRRELSDVPEHLVQLLVEQRLLVIDREGGRTVIELAHDSIIDGWPRLRAWVDEDRETIAMLRALSHAARAWDDAGRHGEDLWRGRRLQSALDLADETNDIERQFLEASVRQRDEETGAARNRRIADLILSARAASAADPRRAVGLAAEAHDLAPGRSDALGAVQSALLGCGNWLGDLATGGVTDGAWIGGTTVVLRDADGITWWDTTRFERTRRIGGLGPGPVASAGGVLVVGTLDGEVRRIDPTSGRPAGSTHLPAPVAALRAHAGGTVAAGDAEGRVWLIDHDGDPIEMGALAARIVDLAVSPCGERVAACAGFDIPVTEWTISTGESRALDPHDAEFPELCGGPTVEYLHDGRLAVGDRNLYLYRPGVAEPEMIATRARPAHVGRVRSNGEVIAVFGEINGLSVVPVDGGPSSQVDAGANLFAGDLAPDGRTALAINGTARLFALDGRTVFGPAVPRGHSMMARIDHEGRWLAGSHVDGFMRSVLWDLRDPRRRRAVHAGHSYCTFRREQSTPVLWCQRERALATWSDGAPDELRMIAARARYCGDFDLTKDGRHGLLGDASGRIHVFDQESGELVTTLDELSGRPITGNEFANMISDIEVAPDGRSFVACGSSGVGASWDVGTWTPLTSLARDMVLAAFAPDGSELYTADATRLAARDPATLEVVRGPVPLPAPLVRPGQGDGLDVTADGRWLVVCTTAGAHLFDPTTLAEVGEPFPNDPQAWSSGLSRGSKLLATCHGDRIHVWDLDPDRWVTTARRLTGQDPSDAMRAPTV
ncbi:MAG: BTAD domain-containing putative transcriptional regulator [Actinomycetota bacterium]|nr:BTAD domain-containing putative transcriptional regulator [Actinomycetota bacterium]